MRSSAVKLFLTVCFAISCAAYTQEKNKTEEETVSDILKIFSNQPSGQTPPQEPEDTIAEKPVKQEKPAGSPPEISLKRILPQKKDHMEYMMPCLTVRGETKGDLSYLPLKFTRTKENKPLRIMIADDTPNGSGNLIHSSVWLAAVTAAMQRNDTLHGTTIIIEFSGFVDGPSAGGVTCLTILSAIDGLPLPDDFAMTGTILPDGSIGVVGGVPYKMRAAAEAGKKRIFIPAFLRFEDGIDLQQLADELNVKLYRVENIAEAYALLHNKPYKGDEYVNVREITRLPKNTEDVLKKNYNKYLEKVNAEIKNNKNLQNGKISPEFILSPYKADTLLKEGKLFPAAIQIFHTWQTWQAWHKANNFINYFAKKYDFSWFNEKYLKEYHYRKLLFSLRKERVEHIKKTADKSQNDMKKYFKKHYGSFQFNGFVPFRKGQTEITAQLESVDTRVKLFGIENMFISRQPTEQQINEADYNTLDTYFDAEISLLRLQELQNMPEMEFNDFLAELAATFPKLKSNKRAVEVERLFYSAMLAAKAIAENNLKGINKESIAGLAQKTPIITTSEAMLYLAFTHHLNLEDGASEKATVPEYHLQGSLKSQITTFTRYSALMFLFGPDRANDFEAYMLRNARKAAVKNINECVKSGIPCLAAIYDLETADATPRNEAGTHEALVAYWRAALYSKALLMSFK